VTASELLATLSQQDCDALIGALAQAVESHGPDLPVVVEEGSPGKVSLPSPTKVAFTVYVER
jgi:hypothetical protein